MAMLIIQTFARDSWPSRENFLATPARSSSIISAGSDSKSTRRPVRIARCALMICGLWLAAKF